MRRAYICLFLSLLMTLLLSCSAQPSSPTIISHTLPPPPTTPPTHTATSTPNPTATRSMKLISTSTPTITVSAVPSSPTGVITEISTRSGKAPSLPHIDVYFITNGSRDEPNLALTFDLCQKPSDPTGFDDGIFNALIKYNAPATFFLGGDWMRTHPEETLLLAGNSLFELGNHSWGHPDMRELTEAEISAEVLKTQDIMYQLTGEQPRLFRMPSGFYNDLALSVIAWHGLYTIQWDVVTADPVPDNTAENMLEIVKDRVQNGSIIIMHANGRGWHTAEALPLIIDYLRGEGYTLVTISQLIDLDPTPQEQD